MQGRSDAAEFYPGLLSDPFETPDWPTGARALLVVGVAVYALLLGGFRRYGARVLLPLTVLATSLAVGAGPVQGTAMVQSAALRVDAEVQVDLVAVTVSRGREAVRLTLPQGLWRILPGPGAPGLDVLLTDGRLEAVLSAGERLVLARQERAQGPAPGGGGGSPGSSARRLAGRLAGQLERTVRVVSDRGALPIAGATACLDLGVVEVAPR